MNNQISLYREQLYYELTHYDKKTKSKIRLQDELIERIIFNVDDDLRKSFVFPDRLMKNIDFTDVSFDNFDFRGFDAIGFYGITINTDSIYNKDLSYSILDLDSKSKVPFEFQSKKNFYKDAISVKIKSFS